MVILILILIYALSAFGMWKFIQIAYSSEGRWSNIVPTSADIFVTFCPVMNTFGCFWFIFSGARRKDPDHYYKFFKVKR
jgi:hypothetical protein